MDTSLYIGAYDLLMAPVYLVFFWVFARSRQNRRMESGLTHYKFYTRGLLVKMGGAIGLSLIYIYYYEGGDTLNYYDSGLSLLKLFNKHPKEAFEIMLGYTPDEYQSLFDNSTGHPLYWTDTNAFFMVRLTAIFCVLGCGSFLVTALVVARISYFGIWKMYSLFCTVFKGNDRALAIAFLFIPSVVFWGSGILKDSITIAAVGTYSYYFYNGIILKKMNFRNFAGVVLSVYFLISLKPYIFFALIPGSLIWAANDFSKKIYNKWARRLFTPLLVTAGTLLGYFLLSAMDDQLGLYSLDNVMERAVIVQQDQKQDYYGGHSFDIGDFDPTLGSMLSKAHLALAATFFRPYIWEAQNPVMVLSGLENLFILGLTIILIFRMKFFGFFRTIFTNPLLLFSFIFSLFFGFAVGLSTSNFGSLVRLKIPCIPFYVATLLLISMMVSQKRKTLTQDSMQASAAG